jgi:hypothetical protein
MSSNVHEFLLEDPHVATDGQTDGQIQLTGAFLQVLLRTRVESSSTACTSSVQFTFPKPIS